MTRQKFLGLFQRVAPDDNGDRPLVLAVLLFSLLIAGALFIAGISRELLFPLLVTLAGALALTWRGHLHLAGLVGPLATFLILTMLMFRNFGIRDTAILGLPAVIIAASLLRGQKGVILFGGLSLAVVAILGLAETFGFLRNVMADHNFVGDYFAVGLLIILTSTLQWAAIGRLNRNLLALGRELDERRRAEQALRNSEESLRLSEDRYRSFVSQSTEGIRRYDFSEPMPLDWSEDEQLQHMLSNMYIAECNDAFAKMYGLGDARQLLGRRLAEMGIADDDANLDGLREFIRSGYCVVDTESNEFGPDGKPRVYLINTIGVIQDGCLVRVWGIQRDVTARKQAEDEIRRLNTELEARVTARTAQLDSANRELETFSYTISHDLRAPLRAVSGFGTMLRSEYGLTMEPDARSMLDKMLEAVTEMGEKIEALLSFSRVARSSPRYEELALGQMAATVIERLRSSEPGRDVECIIDLGVQAHGDHALMLILLENLLGNAWKYSSRAPHAKIEFGTQVGVDGEKVYFVRDNGAGFDMQYADKLFGAFQRLHRADEFPGHGIGLVTVKKIVAHHGGKIWAVAQPKLGATFYFTLCQVPQLCQKEET